MVPAVNFDSEQSSEGRKLGSIKLLLVYYFIKDFPHPPIQARRPTQLPVDCLPRGEAAMGVVLTTKPHLHAEIKDRMELYLYSPSESSRPILG